MKIGIFGGTFNPIHYGHLRAAQEVHESLRLNKTLFIPSGRPPFKKPGLMSAHHRYKMTEIAIKGNPSFDVTDIEIEKQGISYSVDTLRMLRNKYKGAEFFFILGVDASLNLQSWKEPDKLLELTNLVIISRPGFSFIDLSPFPHFKGISKKTLKELDKKVREVVTTNLHTGKKAFLCPVTGLNISASRARNLIKQGKSIKYLLPQTVESYIISHKLYKNSE